MPSTELIGATILMALVLLNLYATMRIAHDKLAERGQKIAQAVLVWVVPLAGAIVVLYLHREERFERREHQINPNDPFAGGDP